MSVKEKYDGVAISISLLFEERYSEYLRPFNVFQFSDNLMLNNILDILYKAKANAVSLMVFLAIFVIQNSYGEYHNLPFEHVLNSVYS